jgi:hypothetical protein
LHIIQPHGMGMVRGIRPARNGLMPQIPYVFFHERLEDLFCADCVVSQALKHNPHCTQENILRFKVRGCKRIGQISSQALPGAGGEHSLRQVLQSLACSRWKVTSIARGFAIHAKL